LTMKIITLIVFISLLTNFTKESEALSFTRESQQRQQQIPSRRTFAARVFASTILTSNLLPTEAAYAVKERNEALCGTGFFTNIAQWYCTEIGDISDEGLGKDLSTSQESTVDSLLSKFDMNIGDGIEKEKEENRQDNSSLEEK